jgi:ASC-1-like (ASCH) protein
MVHKLKVEKAYWNALEKGIKTFELRLNDRNFCKGDIVILRKYNKDNCKYSGDRITVKITYILKNFPILKEKNFCIFSFKAL